MPAPTVHPSRATLALRYGESGVIEAGRPQGIGLVHHRGATLAVKHPAVPRVTEASGQARGPIDVHIKGLGNQRKCGNGNGGRTAKRGAGKLCFKAPDPVASLAVEADLAATGKAVWMLRKAGIDNQCDDPVADKGSFERAVGAGPTERGRRCTGRSSHKQWRSASPYRPDAVRDRPRTQQRDCPMRWQRLRTSSAIDDA